MDWKFGNPDSINWPKDENGEPVAPAYLKHISGGPLDLEVALNLLDAYKIPYVSEFPNNGAFGKLILGQPPSGMEVFVPETMLQEAQDIINATPIEE
ncbi:MAG: hypothetical protein LBC73_08230 [Oscillospiraceae bacterium]|jgi:hypothetical protein|nr:hypothetical protein [Oscillospiraceae bacterium]